MRKSIFKLRLSLSFALVGLVITFTFSTANATVITGKVFERRFKTPIENAKVEVEGTIYSARTDTLGNFQISLPSGEYSVLITARGFHPLTYIYVWADWQYQANLQCEMAKENEKQRDWVLEYWGKTPYGTMSGVVMDVESDAPIQNAKVVICERYTGFEPTDQYVFTDQFGKFAIKRVFGYAQGDDIHCIVSAGDYQTTIVADCHNLFEETHKLHYFYLNPSNGIDDTIKTYDHYLEALYFEKRRKAREKLSDTKIFKVKSYQIDRTLHMSE